MTKRLLSALQYPQADSLNLEGMYNVLEKQLVNNTSHKFR